MQHVREPEETGIEASRTSARIAGVLFLITFATSFAALALFQPVLDDPRGYIAGSGADTRIYLGALFESLLIVANIGTAVVLFPRLRRHNETLALGYVAARIMECVLIAIGIIAVLAVVTLRTDAGGDQASLAGYAESLAAIKDWTFLLGPGFVVGIGNGLILGAALYRSGLVPRSMAMLGLVGGPLIILSGAGVLLDLFEAGGFVQGIATIPEFFWELSLGIYLTIKGFRSQPIVTGEARVAGLHTGVHAPGGRVERHTRSARQHVNLGKVSSH